MEQTMNEEIRAINENSTLTNDQNVICGICRRTFRTNRGLLQHLNFCRRRNNDGHHTNEPAVAITTDNSDRHHDQDQESFYWNEIPGSRFEVLINDAYEKITQWRRNLFLLPTGSSGKKYIEETTRLINLWVNSTPYESIALKAVHVMPALLLQKPSKSSKSKEHLEALTRRLTLWNEGKIEDLLHEGETIQSRLKTPENASNIAKISQKFKNLMSKGNVNGALKLLTNNMSNGVLPLSKETLSLLKLKHPEPVQPSPETLLEGPIRPIHPVVYEDINENLVMRAATLTKGGSGPSGLDADGWRRLFTSRQYGNSSSDLRKAFANFIKKLCVEELESTKSIEAFTANRLIPLDKNPGLRPIGVGEVLRRIAGKVVMMLCKTDVTKAAGSLQVSAGQEAGAEAAVHAMRDIFSDINTDAVLLIDAENAFNSLSRKVMLHNIKFICPVIATYIFNCYFKPSRLFIFGVSELLSKEETPRVTQQLWEHMH